MLQAAGAMALVGVALGSLLGVAARYLAAPTDERAEAVLALLPGSNCGQCGFAGCKQAAAALVEGRSAPNCCPPGGASTAARIAQLLGRSLEMGDDAQAQPRVARIDEARCIGCTRCIKKCSSDAIVGAIKQIHTVLPEVCFACRLCEDECPADAIRMVEVAPTLATWHWPRPAAAAARGAALTA